MHCATVHVHVLYWNFTMCRHVSVFCAFETHYIIIPLSLVLSCIFLEAGCESADSSALCKCAVLQGREAGAYYKVQRSVAFNRHGQQ